MRSSWTHRWAPGWTSEQERPASAHLTTVWETHPQQELGLESRGECRVRKGQPPRPAAAALAGEENTLPPLNSPPPRGLPPEVLPLRGEPASTPSSQGHTAHSQGCWQGFSQRTRGREPVWQGGLRGTTEKETSPGITGTSPGAAPQRPGCPARLRSGSHSGGVPGPARLRVDSPVPSCAGWSGLGCHNGKAQSLPGSSASSGRKPAGPRGPCSLVHFLASFGEI